MKRSLLILLTVGVIAGLLIGCSGVIPPPDGNGEEEIARVVLVELFNTAGCSGCAVVESMLEGIAADPDYSRDKLVFLEEAGWGEYFTPETSDRYKWYLPIENDRSTPNILINGLNKRYHGAAGVSKAILMTQIDTQSNLEAKIKISAQKNTEGSSATVNGTVTNISSEALSNLMVTLMTYTNRGEQGFRYSVTNILSEEIGSLAPSADYTFSLTVSQPDWADNGIHGVVLVQETASAKKEVLQVLEIE